MKMNEDIQAKTIGENGIGIRYTDITDRETQ